MKIGVPEPKTFYVLDVAKAAGLTTNVLRAWEYRYGWPRPTRESYTGYRLYRVWDVENAVRIKKLLDEGWRISQLLKDGIPTWPPAGAKPPQPPRVRRKTAKPPTAPEAE